jgi:uncharacterized membrane protein
MRAVAQSGKLLIVLLTMLSPVAVHKTLLAPGWSAVAAMLVAAQIGLIASLFLSRFRPRFKLPLLALGVGMLALALRRYDGAVLVASTGLPHALAYTAMLIIFGRSLAGNRESMITTLAQRMRGPLSPLVLRYTRRVTLAWCFFFAAQLAVSLTLYLLYLFGAAPLSLWSLFINVANLPLVVLMFMLEYAYRLVRYPTGTGDRFSDFFKVMEDPKEVPARHADQA